MRISFLLREFAFLCLKHYLVLGNFYNFAHTSTSKFSVTIGASPWRLHCLKINTTILELSQFWNLKKKKLSGICNDFIIPKILLQSYSMSDLDKCLWNHYAWNHHSLWLWRTRESNSVEIIVILKWKQKTIWDSFSSLEILSKDKRWDISDIELPTSAIAKWPLEAYIV